MSEKDNIYIPPHKRKTEKTNSNDSVASAAASAPAPSVRRRRERRNSNDSFASVAASAPAPSVRRRRERRNSNGSIASAAAPAAPAASAAPAEQKYVAPGLRSKKTMPVDSAAASDSPFKNRSHLKRASAQRTFRVREITEKLLESWRSLEWWPELLSEHDERGGIINIRIPERSEFSGVTDMHIHVYRNRNEGSGIRISYGPDDNRWRLEYEIKRGKGTFYIRNPDNSFVPRRGFSEDLSLNKLMKEIKAELKKHKNVPLELSKISYSNLASLIELMTYLMEGIQSQRVHGGRKTRKRKRKRGKKKTRKNKKKRKTRRKKKYRKKRTKRHR